MAERATPAAGIAAGVSAGSVHGSPVTGTRCSDGLRILTTAYVSLVGRPWMGFVVPAFVELLTCMS
jgi:hypothetical protein